MATKVKALVKPELLQWARKSSRYDPKTAAKKLRISVERLQEWEEGRSKPTVSQLRRMANVYKKPLAVFYLSQLPKTFDPMRDFRRLPYEITEDISPNLAHEVEKAYRRREVVLELRDESFFQTKEIELDVKISDNPEIISTKVRDLLGVSIEEQYKWRSKYEAFNAWRTSVENYGILLFQTAPTARIPLEEMRGVSISEKEGPIIMLNGTDSVRGKIFTLIHEFIHLLLKYGGICNLDEVGNIEVFCNRIAGTVLVPTLSLLLHPIVSSHKSTKWDDDDLVTLAEDFWVSQEVILRRLVILGKTSEEFYQKKREEYLKRYAKFKEEEKERLREKGLHLPYSKIVIRNNGIPYTKVVLSAYYEEKITASDLSDYLGTKLKHLSKIEEAVFSQESGTIRL
ncbi:MAG TPA: XRE family transcriptional regulator [Chitinophagaceae bacterium]|nr:XRE family transcriptional regulator [Chitinophagaceae bacterium]